VHHNEANISVCFETGVNVQVVPDPAGEVLWISPALPGRIHDLTVARTHRIIRICAGLHPSP
jgi:hypothetical protein